MAIYRQIYMSFWSDDAKVVDDFTPEDKYFYLYLLTNPHTTLIGVYEISEKVMARETGYNEDTVKRLMARMEQTHNVIRYSPKTKEVLLLNWYKYNWTKSEKLLSAVMRQAEYIKNEDFKEYVMALASGGDTVSIPYPYPMDTSVAVPVTDTVLNLNNKKENKRFKAPTVEEVRAYCEERNNGVDPEHFVDYYASQQWKKANGRPVTDWKACIRTWEAKDKPKEKWKPTLEQIERMWDD